MTTPHQALSGTESFPVAIPLRPDELTDLHLTVYQYAVRHGRIRPGELARHIPASEEELAGACAALARLRVLREEDGTLTPVHPDTARVILNGQLTSEIRELERSIARNDLQLERITDALTGTVQLHQADGIRMVPEGVLQREIDAALLNCTSELLTTHLGTSPGEASLPGGGPADVLLLQRGVGRRLLYQHSARASLGTRAAVTRISGAGGEVRTTADSLDRMLIIDRRTALVFFAPPGSAAPRGAVITHPAMVSFVCHIFERLWTGAMTWEPGEADAEKVSGETRLALMRLMASGLKDEAIAHRLGMAPRTCRRHMTSIMEALGATSRIQAGVKIAQLGLLGSERPVRGHWIDAHPFSC